MKRMLVLFALSAAVPALAAPPAGFDAHIQAMMKASETPGMAVAIVENGKTTLARGYGVRKLGGADKVDSDTIFMTGSTGKALTVAALATLVDAGKLGWDDRVSERLPGFQMYDPWVTREMTIRDLLTHRSGLGLGAGDLLVIPRSNRSRADVVHALRYIKPATSFRSGYAYDNILYIVAGRLIEQVSGQSWEDYMREHVFAPAGMATATADEPHHLGTANRAFPHARTGGAVRGAAPLRLLDERDQLGAASAPAGLMALSANDLAKWLTIQLDHGKLSNGGRLFTEADSRQMWAPETIEPMSPLPPELASIQPSFKAYALGWEVSDYHGVKIISHSGGVFGFITMVVLIPDRNVGFAVTMNAEEGPVRNAVTYELLDHYLGLPAQDWFSRFAKIRDQRVQQAIAAIGTKAAAPAKVGPSLPLARYAGTYADAWYGRIAVGSDAKGLTIDFLETPRMAGRLEHWQYDSFIARFDDPGIEPAYVTFGLDADGKVGRVTMKPVSPIADFSFDYQDLLFTPVVTAVK